MKKGSIFPEIPVFFVSTDPVIDTIRIMEFPATGILDQKARVETILNDMCK